MGIRRGINLREEDIWLLQWVIEVKMAWKRYEITRKNRVTTALMQGILEKRDKRFKQFTAA